MGRFHTVAQSGVAHLSGPSNRYDGKVCRHMPEIFRPADDNLLP